MTVAEELRQIRERQRYAHLQLCENPDYLAYSEHNMAHEYTTSACPVFTLALNQVYKYPIEELRDGDQLVHAYCVRPDGLLVDICGHFTRDELTSKWVADVPVFIPRTPAAIRKIWRHEFESRYEVSNCRAFIEARPEVYTFGLRRLMAPSELSEGTWARLKGKVEAEIRFHVAAATVGST